MENRTYRYFKGQPQFAFGYGLSYTTFKCGQGKLSKSSMTADGKVTLTVPVTNTGSREGAEVVQVYVKALDYPEAPIKSLKGFQKVYLNAGQTAQAVITPDTTDLHKKVMKGMKINGYRVQVFAGGNSRSDRQKAERTGENIKSLFPGEPIYVHFYSPRWICRMGNYRTYEEAHEVLKRVKQFGYTSAIIVKGKITVQYQ